MSLYFNLSKERSELLSCAVQWMRENKRIAMATLIHVDGNSPYPVGTQMLISSNAESLGQLTGGCAENSIIQHALESIDFGKNSVHRYGQGSPYFDIQLPCGAGVDIFIDVTTSLAYYESICSSLTDRSRVLQPLAHDTITFTKVHTPCPRLILLGQGAILIQTSFAALAAGFDVMCVVQNNDSHRRASSAGLTAIHIDDCPDLSLLCDENTGLVCLFHEHDFELDVLECAIKTNAYYIGALGSKTTHANRLDALEKRGVGRDALSRICGPVGINIKAYTPAQIAVSIIAEAIDKLNAH